jgi:hypothetical protein
VAVAPARQPPRLQAPDDWSCGTCDVNGAAPAPLRSFAHLKLSAQGMRLDRRWIAGRSPAPTDAQQSSSSSSSSASSSSLCRLRCAGGAVGAGAALGRATGRGGAGLDTAVGCVGGAAGLGTCGAATIGRASGTASVLLADVELGGSLGRATESETSTAGSGGGSDRGSPLMAMTAIPTITPKEVAATPATTSRNMTINRLLSGTPTRLCDDRGLCGSLWHTRVLCVPPLRGSHALTTERSK